MTSQDQQNVVDIICHTLFDQGERSYPCVFKTSLVFSQRNNISKNAILHIAST